jgi:hypothetical protein
MNPQLTALVRRARRRRHPRPHPRPHPSPLARPLAVRTVVLDECDEMLSMGFLEDIRAILDQIKAEHQTALFSATIPDDVERIAKRYMRDAGHPAVGRPGRRRGDRARATTSSPVDQDPRPARRHHGRGPGPRDHLLQHPRGDQAGRLGAAPRGLRRRGALQRPQPGAARAGHEADASTSLRFLVATDVAARGIDISRASRTSSTTPSRSRPRSTCTAPAAPAAPAARGTAISLIGPREIGNFYVVKLQYPSIKIPERHLPPAEQLAAERTELQAWTRSRGSSPSKSLPSGCCSPAPSWAILAASASSRSSLRER